MPHHTRLLLYLSALLLVGITPLAGTAGNTKGTITKSGSLSSEIPVNGRVKASAETTFEDCTFDANPERGSDGASPGRHCTAALGIHSNTDLVVRFKATQMESAQGDIVHTLYAIQPTGGKPLTVRSRDTEGQILRLTASPGNEDPDPIHIQGSFDQPDPGSRHILSGHIVSTIQVDP